MNNTPSNPKSQASSQPARPSTPPSTATKPTTGGRYSNMGAFSYGAVPGRQSLRTTDVASSPGKPHTLASSERDSNQQAETLVPGSVTRARPTVSTTRGRSTRHQGTFNDDE